VVQWDLQDQQGLSVIQVQPERPEWLEGLVYLEGMGYLEGLDRRGQTVRRDQLETREPLGDKETLVPRDRPVRPVVEEWERSEERERQDLVGLRGLTV